ncbi:MAG: YbjQ family protein [Firmicutes bacterium]|nr:YbjQ family protein [Bacillota bacterium]
MLLLTINYVPGKEIEALGIVKGNVVQSKHIGRDIMAGLKNVVGGEIESYTQMLIEAREIATQRMVKEAEAMGADAVIRIEYATSAIMDGTAEMVAYGTAVKYK